MKSAISACWLQAKRILCVRLDSMGDVLMTGPALRALKESQPGRRLTLLTSPSGAAAAQLLTEIDEVLVHEASWVGGGASAPSDELELVRTLQDHAFDAAVIFTVYTQSALPAALICRLAGIPLRLAHCRENPYGLLTEWVKDPEPAPLLRHEVRRQLDLVRSIGAVPPHERLAVSISDEARSRMKRTLNGIGVREGSDWVVVHPGASASSRRYPPEAFAQSLSLLSQSVLSRTQRPLDLILTGSESERALNEEVLSKTVTTGSTLIFSTAGLLDLEALAALLERSRLLISNNTGTVHLASAVGTPVVDLYALTNPQHTPWQVPSRVLFEDVPCRYCLKSVCPQGHQRCLTGVSAARVAAAAREFLERPELSSIHEAVLPPLVTGGSVQCTR